MSKQDVSPGDGQAAAGSKVAGLAARYLPGMMVALTVALAAKYLEQVTAFPALMLALVFGLLLSGVFRNTHAVPGLDYSGKHLLALGVALLGARLTFDDVTALGASAALVVIVAICATLAVSLLAARMLGLSRRVAVLAGTGTAICGASAIAAVASVLPKGEGAENDTAFAVIVVVAVSAVAMIAYPFAAMWLDLSPVQAGVVLGGSIHNVPQAVGAGYSVSEISGNTATLTKLFRVSLLGPLVVAVALMFGDRGGRASKVGLPWFIVVFAALVVLGSVFALPARLVEAMNFLSTWLLLIAISAIGLRTSIASAGTVGVNMLVLVLINSLALLALLVAAALYGLF